MTQFKKLINGRALYQEPDKIWVSRGRKFFAIDYSGKPVTKIYSVPAGIKERLFTCSRVLTQLTRSEIRILLPLSSGNILLVAKRRVLIFAGPNSKDGPEGTLLSSWSDFQGNKPGHQGVCITPEGDILFTEYLLNTLRDKPIRLWRSKDNGATWQVVKEFAPGDIRHLHFVKWDQFAQCLWMGTGDYGENGSENRLYQSTDNATTWRLVGQGSQDWRAIGLCITRDYLYWGTDAGNCPDTAHFVRMRRENEALEIIEDMEGPCHGCAAYADGRLFFTTGVEGGENEKDRIARLKQVREDGSLKTLWQKEKDLWPLIIQYGVIRFPLGTESCSRVCFTSMGLKGHGEAVMMEL